MPATPAWPPKSLPRLFVAEAPSEGAAIELDRDQANYLGNVMRLGVGAELLVFDGSSGEGLAQVAEAAKKRMTLQVKRRTRAAESVPDVWLAFAPVKRAQTDWLVEKATELGAARLVPVITQRTIVDRVKVERLQAVAIEAAEQCGRTSRSRVHPRACDHPDRARGRLHRSRTGAGSRRAGGSGDLARPANPSRRDRRSGRPGFMDGAGRGLALSAAA
jgi:16S rRNA (uracil1498-N3)-methyltransferase